MIIPQTSQFFNTIGNHLLNNFLQVQANTRAKLNPLDEASLASFFQTLSLESIGEYLSMIDDTYANSSSRKKLYTIKQKRSRTIITTLGAITYTRRQYQHRRSREYYYHLDTLIHIEPYQRFTKQLKLEILKMITRYSYHETSQHFGISKNSIYRHISSIKEAIFQTPKLQKKKNVDILYIQADECYAALQKKQKDKKNNKVIIEEIVIHEGLAAVSKRRNKLLNKTFFTRAQNESSVDFYERVYSWIHENYTYRELYFYGDGGAWIKSCAEHMSATFILDLFHTGQSIVRITTDKAMKVALQKAIRNNNQKQFIQIINQLQKEKTFSTFREKQVKYLLNNWKYIQRNFTLKHSVGCSQEGINYHYFAKRLTTHPKGWGIQNLRTIAQLICLHLNETADKDYEIQMQEAIQQNKVFDHPYFAIESLDGPQQFYRQTKTHLTIPRIS